MDNSKIEWTNATWNPLAGCTRASEGCDSCYAAKMAIRLEAMANADIAAGKDPGSKGKYIGIATKNGRGVPIFNGTINLDIAELQRPYTWKKPRMIFVNSMSDLFHKDVPEWFINDVFRVMAENKQHIFQVLTKRPQRAADWANGMLPKNIWFGTSVENQEQADKRIPELLTIPAAVRFLSMEPLLGPVDLWEWIGRFDWRPTYDYWRAWLKMHGMDTDGKPVLIEKGGIDWVIVGGESGPNARPMHPDWARGIRDQCQEAGVPFFFKQWGEWIPTKTRNVVRDHQLGTFEPYTTAASTDKRRIGKTVWYAFPKDRSTAREPYPQVLDIEIMKRSGVKNSGRMLDGREWNEFPQAVTL